MFYLISGININLENTINKVVDMDNNIRIVEEDLAILSRKVDDIESEINNLELKLSLIKEGIILGTI